ncbi:probable G-protein coupled receptor 85 [Trichonephila clavata]|uniref:Probable G-protein coupled receptor 85 n=1 Tax=Trichonephila clavata TaxID=2740835 RepID=A0A8X6L2S9_TRICU|nr:probable G-protein coupled receptor 85 [Trichonephila clavata]
MQSYEEFHNRNVTSLPTPVALFQFISLGLMLAIASAGNCLVIYGFGRFLRLRRRSPHTFMFGFVSMDLARILFCFPIAFVTVVHPLEFKLGSAICQGMAFFNVFILVGNSLNICGMAIDRYFDNKYRAAYRRRCRGTFAVAVILIVNSLALTFAFPAFYSGKTRKPIVQVQCMFPHYLYVEEIQTMTILLSVTTAFCMTNVIYAKLFLLLRGRRRMRPVIYEPAVSENWGFYDPRVGVSVRNRWIADSLSDTPIAMVSRSIFQSHPLPTNYEIALWRSKKQKDNEKLTKLCFAIHVLYSVMWLPYVVSLYYLALTHGKPRIPAWIEISVTWLTYLQPTITPFVFSSLSGLTRRNLRVRNGKRFSPTLSSSSA